MATPIPRASAWMPRSPAPTAASSACRPSTTRPTRLPRWTTRARRSAWPGPATGGCATRRQRSDATRSSCRCAMRAARPDRRPSRFDVAASDRRGFLRVNADDPRFLRYDNGDDFLPIAEGRQWAPQERRRALSYADAFAADAASGVNLTRIWDQNDSYNLSIEGADPVWTPTWSQFTPGLAHRPGRAPRRPAGGALPGHGRRHRRLRPVDRGAAVDALRADRMDPHLRPHRRRRLHRRRRRLAARGRPRPHPAAKGHHRLGAGATGVHDRGRASARSRSGRAPPPAPARHGSTTWR